MGTRKSFPHTSSLHMNHKAHVACNFNCIVESERLLKVTRSHVHCTSGSVSEMMQDRHVVTRDH